MPETVLQFDPESRSLSLGAQKAQADAQAVAETILEYLKSVDEPKTEPEIDQSVEGKTGLKRKALRALVEQRKVEREGAGRKGDPYTYRFSFSCSLDIPGTREQESQKGTEVAESNREMLVPDSSLGSILVPVSPEHEKALEEGEL